MCVRFQLPLEIWLECTPRSWSWLDKLHKSWLIPTQVWGRNRRHFSVFRPCQDPNMIFFPQKVSIKTLEVSPERRKPSAMKISLPNIRQEGPARFLTSICPRRYHRGPPCASPEKDHSLHRPGGVGPRYLQS